MKSHRQGNDLNVRWKLRTSPNLVLEDKSISLYLKDPYHQRKVTGYSIDNNTLSWTFRGADQKHCGIHTLTLCINEGKEGMITVDACSFVNLVSCSCRTGGTDDIGVETETVDIESDVEFIGGGSMTVDTELSETSMNPLANATITAELGKKAEKLSDLDDVILIAPLNDAEVLIGAFKQYDLASKVNVSLLCVVKTERSDKYYQLATLVVEDYRAISAGWRLTFTFNGAKADAESSGKIDEGRVYSPNAWLPDVVLSYLYNEDLGYVIPLGSGNIKFDVELNVHNAVLYTPQELSDVKKKQAMLNIGVNEAIKEAIASAITNVLNEEV